MATPISRDILNQETNARFWTQSGYKPGQRLDPNNPLDRAKMPVWMDIFRKVKAEADAGTLVTTYDRPEVAQPLADAEVASTVATIHVDAAAKSPDPTTAQQHAAAAATATQVVTQKLNEAAANQPPTVSPQLEQEAAREAARTPPPPHAPAADHIAHAQVQNGRNGQFLRPEDDPWDPRYVPKSKPTSPREQPSARPARAPREQPPREVLVKETNARFWLRTRYKPHQKLDMSIAEDRRQSRIWMEIFREVQREANEGRLTFTNPELIPAPNGVRPTPPRPAPRPRPARPLPPPSARPSPPPPPPFSARPPMPPLGIPAPSPGLPPQAVPPWPPPGMQPGVPTWPPPGMPPTGRPQPGMPLPWPPPGMQQPMAQSWQPTQPMQPWQPMQPDPTQPTAEPPVETAPPPPFPTEEASPPQPGALTEPTTEGAPAAGMSTTAKIALGVLGLGGLVGVVYAATRRPKGRSRARVSSGGVTPAIGSSSFAFPPSRGGRS